MAKLVFIAIEIQMEKFSDIAGISREDQHEISIIDLPQKTNYEKNFYLSYYSGHQPICHFTRI